MIPLLVFVAMVTAAAAGDGVYLLDSGIGKQKRQIFREQVSPHTGGRIPADAFRADRLALNRLNAAGISVPDGVLVQVHGAAPAPHHDHVTGHSHSHDPHSTVIKILQPNDGRYVPPEGTVHQQNTVDSTYLVRTPAGWSQHASQLVGLQEPVGPPLQLPGAGSRRPFYPHKSNKPQRPHLPPHPPPSPPIQQHPPQQHPQQQPPQSDVNLTPEPAPFPSSALQPPPNVPPPDLVHHHHHQQHHPTGPSGTAAPHRPLHRVPVATSHQSHNHGRHHLLLQPLSSLSTLSSLSSLSSLLGPEAALQQERDVLSLAAGFQHAGTLPEVAHNDASLINSGLLSDSASFLLEDWATELPGGLLSPEQLAALYNSDHEEKLQHLHALASF